MLRLIPSASMVLFLAGCGSWNASQLDTVRDLARTDLSCQEGVKVGIATREADDRATTISANGCDQGALYAWYAVDRAWVLKGSVTGADGTAKSKPDPNEGLIARVNGTPIAKSVMLAELHQITNRSAGIPADRLARITQNITKRLVDKELLRQAVVRSRIKITPTAIDRGFAEYKKRFQSEEQFQNYLRHGRVTVASIRLRIQEKAELDALLKQTGSLNISAQEIADYYAKNTRFYRLTKTVKASHILIKLGDKATAQEFAAARQKMKSVRKALKKGMDFAAAAKKFSEGPSAAKGGQLGWFGRGQMVDAFEKAAFAMKRVGRLSKVVRTKFGLHLVKYEGSRKARQKPLSEVSEHIRKSLRNRKFFKERFKLIGRLTKTGRIQVFFDAGNAGEPDPAP